jgi:hypothetical protein
MGAGDISEEVNSIKKHIELLWVLIRLKYHFY